MARGAFGLVVDVGRLNSGLSLLGRTVFDTQEAHMRSACQLIVNDIKNRAPVDTGRLRDSYGYRIDSSGGGQSTARLGTDVPYAEHQEFGTSVMAAQPHVRPALEANKEQAAKMMVGGPLSDAIDSV